MKEMSAMNVDLGSKMTGVLSHMDFDILWNQGLLGDDTPEKLFNTVFLIVGMVLHAEKKHSKLRIPFNSHYVTTHSGGFQNSIVCLSIHQMCARLMDFFKHFQMSKSGHLNIPFQS